MITVEEIVSKYWEESTLTGDEFILMCPWCGKDKHFYLNRSNRLGICHSCGRKIGGRKDFYKLVALLKETKGNSSGHKLSVEKHGRIMYHDKLTWPLGVQFDYRKTAPGKIAREYLRSRGVSFELIEHYRIGYVTTGWYAGRVIYPIFEDGELVYYQAGTYRGEKPKYLNPSRFYLRGKKEFVFNLERIEYGSRIIIAEGILDAIHVNKIDGISGVSILGKEISNEQAWKISSREPSEVVIMLDSDATSHAATVANKLAGYIYNDATIKIASLKLADPAKTKLEVLRDVIKEAVPFSNNLEFMASVLSN